MANVIQPIYTIPANHPMNICPKCKSFIGEDGCLCHHDPKDVYMYQNNCWNCGTLINEMNSNWSSYPGMGLVCYKCGNDLFWYKVRTGEIVLTPQI